MRCNTNTGVIVPHTPTGSVYTNKVVHAWTRLFSSGVLPNGMSVVVLFLSEHKKRTLQQVCMSNFTI
jgi:hypothetical protein